MLKKILLLFIVFLVGCTTTVVEFIEDEVKELPKKIIEEQPEETTEEEIIQEPETIEEISAKSIISKKTVSYDGILLNIEGVSENICGINVDGETYWIEEGDVMETDDLTIYMKEIIISHSATGENDACEVTLHKH